MSETESHCSVCGVVATTQCSGCKSVYYCCREHQKSDWRKHISFCKATIAVRLAAEKEEKIQLAALEISNLRKEMETASLLADQARKKAEDALKKVELLSVEKTQAEEQVAAAGREVEESQKNALEGLAEEMG